MNPEGKKLLPGALAALASACEEAQRTGHADEAVRLWHELPVETLKPLGFDLLVSSLGAEKTVETMIGLYTDTREQFRLGSMILGAESLVCPPRQVRTIGMFYYRLENGGVERVMADLANTFVAKGYRVVLFLEQAPGPSSFRVAKEVQLVCLPDGHATDPQQQATRFRQLYAALTAHGVDVFINHAWQSWTAIWDVLAARLSGVPFVMYAHGTFTSYFDFKEVYWLFDGTLREAENANAVVALSETNRAFWTAYSNHVYLMVNPCAFVPTTVSKRNGRSLLWVGRICEDKRPLEAVRILHRVLETVPDAELTIVGAADEQDQPYLERMEQEIEQLGLTERVRLAGYHTNLAPFYAAADVLLVTSTQEGFGLVIAEAKQAGVPCVTYDLPAIIFCEQPEGLVCVPQLRSDLAADAAVTLLTDPEAWQQASNAAKRSAQRLSLPAVVESWQQLFADVAKGRMNEAPVPTAQQRYHRTMVRELIRSIEGREAPERMQAQTAALPAALRYHGPAKKLITALYWMLKTGPAGVMKILRERKAK